MSLHEGGQFQDLAALPLGKEPHYRLTNWRGWVGPKAEHSGKEESLLIPRIESKFPSPQPVTFTEWAIMILRDKVQRS